MEILQKLDKQTEETLVVVEKERRALRYALSVMTKIANEDFRGNRPQASVDCFKGLIEIKKIIGEET